MDVSSSIKSMGFLTAKRIEKNLIGQLKTQLHFKK